MHIVYRIQRVDQAFRLLLISSLVMRRGVDPVTGADSVISVTKYVYKAGHASTDNHVEIPPSTRTMSVKICMYRL